MSVIIMGGKAPQRRITATIETEGSARRRPSTFAELLRAYRRRAGLTQAALAQRAGLSARGVQDIERGSAWPRRTTAERLARALGLNRSDGAALLAAVRARPQVSQERAARDASAAIERPDDGPAVAAVLPGLPMTVASFVGREPQIEAVGRLLTSHRLVTLTGTGGAGKTRLAIEIATRVQTHFADDVRFVSLAPISDPDLVETAVVHALGLREMTGRSPGETIAIGLRRRRLLLVLDNLEHLLEAAPRVGDWLGHCAGLTVLVTSRAPLRLHGEQAYPVPPLTVPGPVANEDRRHEPGQVSASEAGRLFVERALEVRPDFVLSEANASAVAEICRHLDGLPLAIELAAAKVSVLSPSQIAERLDDRFGLLVGGSRDAPARQQTLRATIDWSYALLSEAERILFRRLAVFVGGFTLEAAERVAGAGYEMVGGGGVSPTAAHLSTPRSNSNTSDSPSTLDLLATLVEQSLVVADEQHGRVRYRLLESLHELGLEQLDAADEVEELRRRHASYFLGLAEAADTELIGPDQIGWLDRLEGELDNLRAVLGWSLAASDGAGERTEIGLRIAGALQWLWLHHDHLGEARGWLDATLAMAGTAASATARARALLASLMVGSPRAEYDLGRAAGEESCRLCRELGDQRGLGRTLTWLGTAAMFQGDLAAARAYHEESVAVLRAADDPWGLGLALNQLGGSTRRLGELDLSRRLRAEGAEILRQTGERWGLMQACITWGNDLLHDREYTRAAALYREAISPCLELRDTFSVCRCLNGLAGVFASTGDAHRAARLLGATEAQIESISARLLPPDQAHFDRSQATLTARLGAERLAVLREQGRGLSLQQAIDLANQPADARPGAPVPDAPHAAAPLPSPLSAREREVAALVARGLTNREIATELVIAEWTAVAHVRNILTKLGLSRRAQVAAWGAEQGLLPDQHA
jgi:predicted ATPase/DNA-binding CsgD family transcriptional regulator/transcriptional regulator with XRE-family HTH domain